MYAQTSTSQIYKVCELTSTHINVYNVCKLTSKRLRTDFYMFAKQPLAKQLVCETTDFRCTSTRVLRKQMIEQGRARKEIIEENSMFFNEKGTGNVHSTIVSQPVTPLNFSFAT